MRLYDYVIKTSSRLTKDGDPQQIERMFWERWFTKPWNPFKKYRTYMPQVPSDKIILDYVNKIIYLHPELLPDFKATIDAAHAKLLLPSPFYGEKIFGNVGESEQNSG